MVFFFPVFAIAKIVRFCSKREFLQFCVSEIARFLPKARFLQFLHQQKLQGSYVVRFLFFLFIAFILFSQVNIVWASNDANEIRCLPRNCYRYTKGYYDDNNQWQPALGWEEKEVRYAFFPGLVPCGVKICSVPWEEFDEQEHGKEGQHVPGWYCPGGNIDEDGNPDGVYLKQRHHCTICHLFIMFFSVISFIFVTLVPLLAVVVIAIAGATIGLSRDNPEMFKTGQDTLKNVVIGLLLIYGAFTITSIFFNILGFIQWEGFGNNLFSVSGCEVIRIIVEKP